MKVKREGRLTVRRRSHKSDIMVQFHSYPIYKVDFLKLQEGGLTEGRGAHDPKMLVRIQPLTPT